MATDIYYGNVTLLLHMDGVDGSTTFTDQKSHTVTANGNAQIDTAQFKFGGASALFDGTGDYLQIADSSEWDLPGDFTIEFWFYPTTDGGGTSFDALLDFRADNTNVNGTPLIFYGNENDKKVGFLVIGGISIASSAVTINNWYHVAITRSGASIRLFVNGVLEASATSNTSLVAGQILIGSGAFRASAPATAFTGQIDDVRITKGVARYTAAFNPPVEAFSNTWADPEFNSVVFLCHANGTNGSTTFTDVKGNTITPSGDAQISTAQSVFGGASAVFDGTGDYLTSTNSPDFIIGSSDFTVELWARFVGSGVTQLCVSKKPVGSAGLQRGLLILRDTDDKLYCLAGDSSGVWDVLLATSSTISTNTWYHIAFTRSGSTWRGFLDGVEFGNASSAITVNDDENLVLGINQPDNASGLNGFLDEIRITKGVSRYNSNFVPPNEPFPDQGSFEAALILAKLSAVQQIANIGKFSDLSLTGFLEIQQISNIGKFSHLFLNNSSAIQGSAIQIFGGTSTLSSTTSLLNNTQTDFFPSNTLFSTEGTQSTGSTLFLASLTLANNNNIQQLPGPLLFATLILSQTEAINQSVNRLSFESLNLSNLANQLQTIQVSSNPFLTLDNNSTSQQLGSLNILRDLSLDTQGVVNQVANIGFQSLSDLTTNSNINQSVNIGLFSNLTLTLLSIENLINQVQVEYLGNLLLASEIALEQTSQVDYFSGTGVDLFVVHTASQLGSVPHFRDLSLDTQSEIMEIVSQVRGVNLGPETRVIYVEGRKDNIIFITN